MKFKHRYNHSVPVSPVGEHSLTDPQFLKETDVNIILKKYRVTGLLPTSDGYPSYGDFSHLTDFSKCLDLVNDGQAAFSALPSDLRARFGHDSKAFFDFVLDPDNEDECIRLGLRERVIKEETSVDVLKDIRARVTASADPAPRGEGRTPNT